MNVLFHIIVGASIAVGISDIIDEKKDKQNNVTGFVLGILSHGIIDYIPHCYPIGSRFDVILGLLIILSLIFIAKKKFKLLISITLLGSLFPDLVDLSPGILNSLFNINLPIFDNIFPWHFHKYSGSIYIDDCTVSNINHILTLIFCLMVIALNRNKIKKIFKLNE